MVIRCPQPTTILTTPPVPTGFARGCAEERSQQTADPVAFVAVCGETHAPLGGGRHPRQDQGARGRCALDERLLSENSITQPT